MLIVDDESRPVFYQAAAALRRLGLRVTRVCSSAEAQFRRRPADHLLFNETLLLSQPAGVARLDELLAAGAVADVIFSESALPAIADAGLRERLQRASLNHAPRRPFPLSDKFAVNTYLAAHGAMVPQQMDAAEFTPREAAQRLGLPLVVKGRVGAGGDKVRIAASTAEICRAVAELGYRDLFYQEHVPGRMVYYGAVVGPKGPVTAHGFAYVGEQYPLGPSAGVQLYDRPELLAQGRRVVELLGCRGFAEIGFVETPSGGLFHVDANCRVWGSVLPAAPLGVNYAGAYAALLRGETFHERGLGPADRLLEPLPVFPFTLMHAAASAGRWEFAKTAARFLRAYWGTAGAAYCLLTLFQAVRERSRRA